MSVSLLLFSHPDVQAAEHLVRTLVEDRVIACGHLFPAGVSIYSWEGKTVRDQDVNVLVKLSRAACPVAMERIRAAHPYRVPEILSWSVEEGNPDYLEWVLSSSLLLRNEKESR